jgi:hypothetical protein
VPGGSTATAPSDGTAIDEDNPIMNAIESRGVEMCMMTDSVKLLLRPRGI